MIQFSICLETIFNTLPLTERIEQAAACGASAVEFWDWRDKDLDEVARVKESAGVDVAAFAASLSRPPNDPAALDSVAAEVLESIEAARGIGAGALIFVAEREIESVPREEQLAALATVLKVAAPAAQKARVSLLLEPLNRVTDHPEALLSRTADTLAVIEQVGEPNVKMLFDVYHQYTTEGTVLNTIEAHADRIGHFHLADVPGRGEPGTGALDWKEILKLIESLDYTGYVGLEFVPSADHADAVRSVMELL